jgi:hypothetical protein
MIFSENFLSVKNFLGGKIFLENFLEWKWSLSLNMRKIFPSGKDSRDRKMMLSGCVDTGQAENFT